MSKAKVEVMSPKDGLNWHIQFHGDDALTERVFKSVERSMYAAVAGFGTKHHVDGEYHVVETLGRNAEEDCRNMAYLINR